MLKGTYGTRLLIPFFQGGEAMKRITLALTFLLATSGVASAQFSPSKENLRGLTGVRLVVRFAHCPKRDLSNCAEGLDEAQRPEVLKVLEADATAKLQNAGIAVFRSGEGKSRAGDPKLIILATLDKPNGFNYPIVTEVMLMERVRLVREPSIEYDAVTWSQEGVGGAEVEISKIRWLVTANLDHFIKDYLSVNPKQSVNSGKNNRKIQ
jgi:hypothetical protein